MILDGLKVVDLSTGIAGSMAALQLSEAGADVARIEPEGGSRERGTALFSVLNRGKRSVVLGTAERRRRLDQLLSAADVLIHDLTPTQAHRHGLDDKRLAALNPRLIVSAITGWPGSHPRADAPARETLVLAALGLLDEQPGHRPGPIFVRMPFASWISGWLAAVAIAARLIARERDGRGGAAHTSLAQGALVPMTMHWSRAERPSPVFAKGLSKKVPIPLHLAADGRWIHVHYSPDKAPWMAKALKALGAAAVKRLNDSFPPSHVAPNFGANKAIIATRPAEDWVRHFWEHDVAAQIAAPFGDIYADPQAEVNGFVARVDDPFFGLCKQPGISYSTSPPAQLRGGLQPLGADTESVTKEWRPIPAGAAAGTGTGLPPLHGLKVLDLGAYLAGPFATMLLADLGAEVVKVEPPSGDAMRRLERQFTGVQRGKRGLALNLGDPATSAIVQALAGWADIVHHNIRRPAARKLGIDYETLATDRPGLIYCHVSSYGPVGDRADWPGFDQLFQAACGWEMESGGEGNPPLWLRFGVMDHYAALASVFATLLAVIERNRSGRGQAVASSLLGGAMLTMAEAVVREDGSLTPIEHLDGEQMGLTRAHRLYRALDGMIAVAALEPGEALALDRLAGDDALAFFAALGSEDSKARLDEAGVPGEIVGLAQIDAFLDSKDNEAAGLHANYRHRDYGALRQIGALWSFGDLPLALDRPAPALGEHSREILAMIGMEDRYAALVEAGLTV